MINVVHHSAYVTEAPSRSSYRWGKNGAIRDLLQSSMQPLRWHEPVETPLAWLEAVHDPAYVAEVVTASVPKMKERRIGFAVTEIIARRAQLVPGGTWLAAKIALDWGYAANTAGGSHHALADTGAGYCVFNDLAIAAIRLVEEASVERVMIVDCDVHQGDGTAALTAGRSEISTYSIHAEKNFPARKARSTFDVPLADGVGDTYYLATLERTLSDALDAFRPSLVLYQAGVDPYIGDKLGRLAISDEGLVKREHLVARLMKGRRIPLASTVGGGYGDDVVAIAERHVRAIVTLGAALGNRICSKPA